MKLLETLAQDPEVVRYFRRLLLTKLDADQLELLAEMNRVERSGKKKARMTYVDPAVSHAKRVASKEKHNKLLVERRKKSV